jgi:transposase
VDTATAPIILALTSAFGFSLAFLPAYSPELDAAELVFNQAKRDIRHNRSSTQDTLWVDLTLSLAKISHSTMFSFYQRALYGWVTEAQKK